MCSRIVRLLVLGFLLHAACVLNAQQNIAQKFIATAASLVNGAAAVSDVQLSGTVIHTAGSVTENGSVRIQANSAGRMRIDATYPDSTREEYYSGTEEAADCAWTDQTATAHPISVHNCITGGVPLAPLIIASSYSGTSDFSLGLSSDATGRAIITVFPALLNSSADAAAIVQRSAQAQIVFDSKTYLPLAYRYKLHPDNDAGRDIPSEIRFSNYQTLNGVQIPRHIQRFVNGALELDITITSAVLNSNLNITK